MCAWMLLLSLSLLLVVIKFTPQSCFVLCVCLSLLTFFLIIHLYKVLNSITITWKKFFSAPRWETKNSFTLHFVALCVQCEIQTINTKFTRFYVIPGHFFVAFELNLDLNSIKFGKCAPIVVVVFCVLSQSFHSGQRALVRLFVERTNGLVDRYAHGYR